MKTDTIVATIIMVMIFFALPAAASDYTLGVFGNANGDETINMQDVTFTELIILEYEDATELADARYDSEIDILDVTQIELVILGTEKELTLIDSAERIITVEKPVERMVVHHPATIEAVKLLGAEDRVVGRCSYLNEILFPKMIELPVTSGIGYEIYYEEVFEVDPDIFLTAKIPIPGFVDVVDMLEPDVPVVALNFFEPHTLVENTKKLRYILNTKKDSDAFIAFYEGVINDITEETAGLSEGDKPKVFYKFSGMTPDALTTFTNHDPGTRYRLSITGAMNIAADLPGEWIPEVDQEWLIEANPDIVVASIQPLLDPGSFGYEVDDNSVAKATKDEIMAMDVFADSNAVSEEKVYLHYVDLMITPRFVVGVAYWAKWFHPELFSDLDPQAIHQEYLTDFLGIDYDLDEHGVFVYPKP